jgi:hypothetical protein
MNTDTCECVVYRSHWPDLCMNKAAVPGVLTLTSGRRFKVSLCKRHAKQTIERPTKSMSTRNRRIEPDYPYIASGSWEPIVETEGK